MEDISNSANGLADGIVGSRLGTEVPGTVGTRAMVYFPDVIETIEDSPVLLGRLSEASTVPGQESGLSVVGINGVDISQWEAAQLPGVRVGEGDGAGYVYRRSLDGQLVFSPDAGFTGVTAFTYTIADAYGQSATLVATLGVYPSATEAGITFADGTQFTSVAEGVDSSIVGALNVDWARTSEGPVEIKIFEGESDTPSKRFSVSGDKLQLSGGVNTEAEDSIPLRIVASVDGVEVASGEFEIEVRSTGGGTAAAQAELPETFMFAQRPTLAYSAEFEPIEPMQSDQFFFEPLIDDVDGHSAGLDAIAAQTPGSATADAYSPETKVDPAQPATPSGGGDFTDI